MATARGSPGRQFLGLTVAAPSKPHLPCPWGPLRKVEGISKSIPLLGIGASPPPATRKGPDLQPPGGDSLGAACVAPSWDLQGVTGVGLTWIRPSFWLFLGSGGTGQHRIVSILTCWKWRFVVLLWFFLSLEVLTERPVSSFWWKQWFLEHVVHSNTFSGNFLNGEKHGLKNWFKISCITTKH